MSCGNSDMDKSIIGSNDCPEIGNQRIQYTDYKRFLWYIHHGYGNHSVDLGSVDQTEAVS